MKVEKGNNDNSEKIKIITRNGGERYPIFIMELPDGVVIIECESPSVIKKVSGFERASKK